MPVQTRYYTDPACPRSWAAEPELRRLMWEFGDELDFRWVMGGLARAFGGSYRDQEAGVSESADTAAALAADWLRVTAESGMPIDPRLWFEGGLDSSYPACLAVVAASEQGSRPAYSYLRRLREGILAGRRKLDHRQALLAEAGATELDTGRFRIDLDSNATVESFAAALDEVRSAAEGAREPGAVSRTEGRERVAFPSAVFVAEDGTRRELWGRQPYEAYRDAARAAGAEPSRDRPHDALAVIEHFGRVATREVEVVMGRPRPVVEADLWGLAREWRLKPIPVLNGTLWELA